MKLGRVGSAVFQGRVEGVISDSQSERKLIQVAVEVVCEVRDGHAGDSKEAEDTEGEA